MLVFVDESGDPGLTGRAGASKYFILVLVVFEDLDEAQKADDRIELLRGEMGLHPRFEFRFSHCSRDLRFRFLETVAHFDFFYCGVVIDKARLTKEEFSGTGSFYQYASKLLFEGAKTLLSDATVVIDGSGSRASRMRLERYLKRLTNDPQQRSMRKVKTQDSSRNNLLQLADMIAGAVHRGFSSRADAKLYQGIVVRRQRDVQFWPK